MSKQRRETKTGQQHRSPDKYWFNLKEASGFLHALAIEVSGKTWDRVREWSITAMFVSEPTYNKARLLRPMVRLDGMMLTSANVLNWEVGFTFRGTDCRTALANLLNLLFAVHAIWGDTPVRDESIELYEASGSGSEDFASKTRASCNKRIRFAGGSTRAAVKHAIVHRLAPVLESVCELASLTAVETLTGDPDLWRLTLFLEQDPELGGVHHLHETLHCFVSDYDTRKLALVGSALTPWLVRDVQSVVSGYVYTNT